MGAGSDRKIRKPFPVTEEVWLSGLRQLVANQPRGHCSLREFESLYFRMGNISEKGAKQFAQDVSDTIFDISRRVALVDATSGDVERILRDGFAELTAMRKDYLDADGRSENPYKI